MGGGGGGGNGWRNKRGGRMRLESGLLLCQNKVTVPLLFEYTEAIGMLIKLCLTYELKFGCLVSQIWKFYINQTRFRHKCWNAPTNPYFPFLSSSSCCGDRNIWKPHQNKRKRERTLHLHEQEGQNRWKGECCLVFDLGHGIKSQLPRMKNKEAPSNPGGTQRSHISAFSRCFCTP